MPWLIARTPNRTIFYSSGFVVLLLAMASYYLAAMVQVKPTYYVGYYTMLQYSLMAIAMLLAWKSAPEAISLKDIKWLLIIAVAARIILVDAGSYASNDVDRYLFDGRIVVEGLDPYRVSHDAKTLEDLRAKWHPPSEHAKYVTLYPPLALALFTFAASFGLSYALLAWKLIILSASLATLFFATKVLINAKKLQHLSLVALSPLLILEANIGLHIDTISTLAVVIAIYAWQQHKIILTGIVIGLGTAIKVVPIMLLLPLVFTMKSLGNATKLVFSTILALVLIYAIALLFGLQPVGSISVFFEKWRFAAPLFVSLEHIFTGYILLAAMIVFACCVCIASGSWLWYQRQQLAENTPLLFGIAQLALAVPLLISPVIFPWYLMPLVPLLALSPNRYLILWMICMPLTYEVLNGFLSEGIWLPAQWPVLLVGLVQCAATIAIFYYLYRHRPKRSLLTAGSKV